MLRYVQMTGLVKLHRSNPARGERPVWAGSDSDHEGRITDLRRDLHQGQLCGRRRISCQFNGCSLPNARVSI